MNRDNLLKQYCLNNNIKLVNIRDVDINRIFEILSKLFSNGEDITTKVEPKLLPIPYGKNLKNLLRNKILELILYLNILNCWNIRV